MLKERRSWRGRRGNVLILVALVLPLLVGLVGLAIDGTMCYIVQTEISAAVDGASLGTGRMLTAITTNAQATAVATDYLNANFRQGTPGFWGSYSLGSQIVPDVSGTTKTVKVTAWVTVPLLFMRIFGKTNALVGATGTASRRDVRVEFIIDRSGSMHTTKDPITGQYPIDELKGDVQNFIKQFTPGHDEMGLIAFSGSAVVGYPTTPWGSPLSVVGGGGPDTSFCPSLGNCGTSSTDMYSQVGNITAGNGTGMGEALALAYIEMQKAHVRDAAANKGIDNRANVIVLFTDGVPSAVSTYLNQPSNPVIDAGTIASGHSGCTYATDDGSHPMYGYIVWTGSPSYWGATVYTLAQLANRDSAAGSSVWWMSQPLFDQTLTPISTPNKITPFGGFAGCDATGCSNQSNLKAVPSKDAYGYPLTPSTDSGGGVKGYMLSNIIGGSGGTSVYETAHGDFSPAGNQSQGYQWGLAGWDEVDNTSIAIRTDANFANRVALGDTSNIPLKITIMTIGYTGNGGTDAGLLTKIANVSGCSVKNPFGTTLSCVQPLPQQPGTFIPASNSSELSNAMSTILGLILRLSQ